MNRVSVVRAERERTVPKVSIIMTSYNKPTFVGRAIEAILQQTCTDFELLLMDDNSNEETQKAMEPFLEDERVLFFRSDTKSIHERASKVRYAVLINKALDMAKGKFISYATDDNIYHPERLEKMVRKLESDPQLQIVYSASTTTHLNSHEETVKIIQRPATSVQWIASCAIDHCSIMHRKSILTTIHNKWGSYWDEDPQFYRTGDARFFWRLNHFWPFHPLNEELDTNFITDVSFHHELFAEEKSEFIKLLPVQRTCKELREDIRKKNRRWSKR